MSDQTAKVNNDSAQRIVVSNPSGRIKMEVKTDGETVWLTQEQMCQLFGRERSVITKHIRNVFRDGELDESVVCAKFAHTTLHGAILGKTQTREVAYYNLDVVISVGYLVKQLSMPQVPVRQRIGFNVREADNPTKPYGKL